MATYDGANRHFDEVAGPSRPVYKWLELWLPPTIVAVAILAPILRPGAVFNLDLVLPPHLDLPAGVWGLGPELPRRVPLWSFGSLLDRVVPAAVIGKALMAGCLAGAWVGMVRLVRSTHGLFAGHVAGALYAVGPFVLTRTAVGHFMVTVPHALLPWVLPILLRPGHRLRYTFYAATALAFGGHFGGSVAVLVLCVAAVVGDRRRWWAGLAVTVVAQLVWIVPGVLVLWSTGTAPVGGVAFHTVASGPLGLARLSAGGGFWNAYFQAGGSGLVEALAGAALLIFAIVGTSELPASLRRPLVWLGVFGWLVGAVSAIPGLGRIADAATENAFGGIWREGHRLLGLHLLWLAPSAVLGARRLARSTRVPTTIAGALGAAPVAIALVLTMPSVWGIGGQLEATPLPAAWNSVRAQVREQPGTVLALPWFQYFNLRVGEGRTHRVLNPLPLYLGGDVLSSSNNGLGVGTLERGDPREQFAAAAVADLERGIPVAGALGDMGVRWIVVLKSDAHQYPELWADVGLSIVVDSPAIALFAVDAWLGAGVDGAGRPVDLTRASPALLTPATAGEFTWFAPGSRGWRRDGKSATVTDRGVLAVPAGDGRLWNVLAIPCLLSQMLPVVGLAMFLTEVARRRRLRVRAANPGDC